MTKRVAKQKIYKKPKKEPSRRRKPLIVSRSVWEAIVERLDEAQHADVNESLRAAEKDLRNAVARRSGTALLGAAAAVDALRGELVYTHEIPTLARLLVAEGHVLLVDMAEDA